MSLQRSAWMILCALGALLAVPAYAGTIRHDRPHVPYITLGQNYPSVGQLLWTDGGGSFIASGTLIRDNWVLTAGHVTSGVGQVGTFTINNTVYNVSDWIEHPNWTGNLNLGFDIGLVRLSTSVTGVTPAQLYTGSAELGKTGTAVGFGATGTGLAGFNPFSTGTKRAGTNRIDGTSASFGMADHYLMADFDDPGNADGRFGIGPPIPTALEYSIAPGDSGGGMFINFDGGLYVAGVNSFGLARLPPLGDGNANSSYSDFNGFTRVSMFDDWINETIDGLAPSAAASGLLGPISGIDVAANLAFLNAPTGAQVVPEPNAFVLLISALIAFVVWRYLRTTLSADPTARTHG